MLAEKAPSHDPRPSGDGLIVVPAMPIDTRYTFVVVIALTRTAALALNTVVAAIRT